MSSAKTTTGIKGDANLDYWREVPCPDCKKVQWIGGFLGQTCSNCGYEVGFGTAKEKPGPYEKCMGAHLWTHVPKSEEDLNEGGDTYKCYYCLIEG